MYAQFSRKIKRNGMYPKAKCLSRRPVILHGRLITKNIYWKQKEQMKLSYIKDYGTV